MQFVFVGPNVLPIASFGFKVAPDTFAVRLEFLAFRPPSGLALDKLLPGARSLAR